MAAFDYRLNLPNPVENVLQGLMVGQKLREQQMAQQRQQSMQAAIQDLRTNATPEKFADFYLRFPELKEQMDSYRSALGEGDKTTLTSAAREATLALKSGKPDEIASIFDRYASAAENSRRPELVKQFRDAQKYVQSYPEGAELAVKMFYQGVDPDGFKALNEHDLKLDTSLIKNLVAEGLEPGSPEFKSALQQDRTKVTVTLPNGGFFSGPADELRQILGGVPASAQRGRPPRVQSKEAYDKLPPGTLYTDPEGAVRTKPGGPTQPASGTFR